MLGFRSSESEVCNPECYFLFLPSELAAWIICTCKILMALLQGHVTQHAAHLLRCRPFLGTPVPAAPSTSQCQTSARDCSICITAAAPLPVTHVESSQKALDTLRATANQSSEQSDPRQLLCRALHDFLRPYKVISRDIAGTLRGRRVDGSFAEQSKRLSSHLKSTQCTLACAYGFSRPTAWI